MKITEFEQRLLNNYNRIGLPVVGVDGNLHPNLKVLNVDLTLMTLTLVTSNKYKATLFYETVNKVHKITIDKNILIKSVLG